MSAPLYSATVAQRWDSRSSLRDCAEGAGVLFGAAVNPRLFADADYARVVAATCNMIEPENAMKWAAIRPAYDAFDYHEGDQVAAFARAHGQRVRGHVLVWDAYNPAWLRRGNFGAPELNRILRDHIYAVAEHYADQVFAWDVINEVFADGDSGALRSSIWYDRPGIGFAGKGTAYVEELFRWTRAAAPDALLFYNDDPLVQPGRFPALCAMLTDFRERDVPIDGVGLQMHLDLATSLEPLHEMLSRLAALDLQVHITELDIAIRTGADGTTCDPDDLERQADRYREVIATCLEFPACTALQTWGIADQHSWIPEFSRGEYGAALLFDPEYQPKPAYYAIMEALTRKPTRTLD